MTAISESTVGPAILPYCHIVGQDNLKLALDLSYITSRIGGVLISGQRGAGKSTAVRAFARMVYGELPVTLPINVTDDRVVGGWSVSDLMKNATIWQPGLLEEANGKLLFIDEVNLLDDHIANIILDCVSTGVLVVQRDGHRDEKRVAFVLVGTMNPEEGGLRPQLLDRFGLMVNVKTETANNVRRQILRNVLEFDTATRNPAGNSGFLASGYQEDAEYALKLDAARQRYDRVEFPEHVADLCIHIANTFHVEGHRADYVMAFAAKALAAWEGSCSVTQKHVQRVAPMALQHRLPDKGRDERNLWTDKNKDELEQLLQGFLPDHA